MRQQVESRARFQRHLLAFTVLVVLFAVFNGFDAVWMAPAGLWLVAVIFHAFSAYRLGPFSRF